MAPKRSAWGVWGYRAAAAALLLLGALPSVQGAYSEQCVIDACGGQPGSCSADSAVHHFPHTCATLVPSLPVADINVPGGAATLACAPAACRADAVVCVTGTSEGAGTEHCTAEAFFPRVLDDEGWAFTLSETCVPVTQLPASCTSAPAPTENATLAAQPDLCENGTLPPCQPGNPTASAPAPGRAAKGACADGSTAQCPATPAAPAAAVPHSEQCVVDACASRGLFCTASILLTSSSPYTAATRYLAETCTTLDAARPVPGLACERRTCAGDSVTCLEVRQHSLDGVWCDTDHFFTLVGDPSARSMEAAEVCVAVADLPPTCTGALATSACVDGAAPECPDGAQPVCSDGAAPPCAAADSSAPTANAGGECADGSVPPCAGDGIIVEPSEAVASSASARSLAAVSIIMVAMYL